jgi:hypothetical protein
MAKAAVAEKKPAARAPVKAPAKAPAKRAPVKKQAAVDEAELEELSALAASAKELEDEERAKSGSNSLFITLVQGNSNILVEGDPRHVKGVKLHDYVIAQKKLLLGPSLDATVLGHFKLYAEKKKKERENEMAPTVQFWMPEQAEDVPIGPGEIFARPLTNGNVLLPVHWVFLYLHGHPELEGVVLPFQSTGNRIYEQLKKQIKAETKICTELRFKIGKQGIHNDDYKTTYYFPAFTAVGKNFTMDDDGRLSLESVDAATAKEILKRSKELQEDYAAGRIVTLKSESSVRTLVGSPSPVAALPPPQQVLDDGDHEPTRF